MALNSTKTAKGTDAILKLSALLAFVTGLFWWMPRLWWEMAISIPQAAAMAVTLLLSVLILPTWLNRLMVGTTLVGIAVSAIYQVALWTGIATRIIP